MNRAIVFHVIALAFLLVSCSSSSGSATAIPVPPTEPSNTSAPPTVTSAATPTTSPTPTSVFEASTEPDTIYFWWLGNGKNELWRLSPDGNSAILYTLRISRSLSEAVKEGLITEETAEAIEQFANQGLQTPLPDSSQLRVQVFAQSLSLSPNKRLLAWTETADYCHLHARSDIVTCVGDLLLRVLDLETGRFKIILPLPDNTYTPIRLSWSPNSDRLAYAESPPANVIDGYLLKVLNVDTGRQTEVAHGRQIVWLPNGHEIAVVTMSPPDTSSNIRHGLSLYNLEEPQSHAVLPTELHMGDLALSPDGNTLAFAGSLTPTPVSSPAAYGDQLFTVDLRTGVVKTLSKNENGFYISNLTWSSDGQNILYIQYDSDPSIAANYHLYIREVRTAKLLDEILLESHSGGSLSSDGNKMLFIGSDQSGAKSLQVLNLLTRQWNAVPYPAELVTNTLLGMHESQFWDYYHLHGATW